MGKDQLCSLLPKTEPGVSETLALHLRERHHEQLAVHGCKESDHFKVRGEDPNPGDVSCAYIFRFSVSRCASLNKKGFGSGNPPLASLTVRVTGTVTDGMFYRMGQRSSLAHCGTSDEV